MQTKNEHFGERPDRVVVRRNGKDALVLFPLNVTEVQTEDGSQWLAETVYSMRTKAVPGLEERINANYDAWLEAAKKAVEPQTPTMADLVDAVNTLTDLLIGGM